MEKMNLLLADKEKQLVVLEEREKERHIKLIQDVNHLPQQRDMLLIEKTQLEEDFKQADLAFNDEVALRLKFEYRINEIHSIHRELIAKHNKLLDDIIVSASSAPPKFMTDRQEAGRASREGPTGQQACDRIPSHRQEDTRGRDH